MDLRVVSFNVRGLSTLSAERKLRVFLNSLQFNVLFLQETKLREDDWDFIGCRIWRDGVFFIAPAAPGAHAL
jgi:exonuclease III